jgi:hypothetical protein
MKINFQAYGHTRDGFRRRIQRRQVLAQDVTVIRSNHQYGDRADLRDHETKVADEYAADGVKWFKPLFHASTIVREFPAYRRIKYAMEVAGKPDPEFWARCAAENLLRLAGDEDWLLRAVKHVQAEKQRLPVGTLAESSNGSDNSNPDERGWWFIEWVPASDLPIPWVLVGETYKLDATAIDDLSANWNQFETICRDEWGAESWVGQSAFLYNTGSGPHYDRDIVSAWVTEVGADRTKFSCPGCADAAIVEAYCSALAQNQQAILHEWSDPRFLWLWEQGDTSPLWNETKYRELLARTGTPIEPYSGAYCLNRRAIEAIAAVDKS